MRPVRSMGKLEDFMRKPGPAPKGETIDLDGMCQRCFENVDEAEYFYIEKLLKWVCSQGHVSYLEDFVL